MEVELLIRWMKPKSKEREEAEKHRNYLQERLGIDTNSELEPEKYEDVFSYDPMTFNIDDIARFNRVDSHHTCLTFKDGARHVAKVPYESFQGIWEGITLRRIMIINNNRLEAIEKEVKDY